jgi:hypothetical protein
VAKPPTILTVPTASNNSIFVYPIDSKGAKGTHLETLPSSNVQSIYLGDIATDELLALPEVATLLKIAEKTVSTMA